MTNQDDTRIWARSAPRRSGGGGFVGLLASVMAVFGMVVAVVGVREGSLAQGGAVMDRWIERAAAEVRSLAGRPVQARPEDARLREASPERP